MITHLPLCSLPRAAKRVLVIGGGDGGVLREVARHSSVETIEICELDEMVPEISKRYFPKMATGFADTRVQCHFMDGFKFLEEAEPGTYDAIIVDSSDPVGKCQPSNRKEQQHRNTTLALVFTLEPGAFLRVQISSYFGPKRDPLVSCGRPGLQAFVTTPFFILLKLTSLRVVFPLLFSFPGPAASLFQKPFFDLVHRALSDQGVVCTQAESIWLHLDIIKELHLLCNQVFVNSNGNCGSCQYAYCTIPTYPSGQIGFMISSKSKIDFEVPKQDIPESEAQHLLYYTKEIHRASFVLPQFAKKAISQ